jgi:hypothetical protein
MPAFDVTNPIAAYSTHCFPPDAGVPVFITVYKTGAATAEDVAGYLMFTDRPAAAPYRDRVSVVQQYVVKHFRTAQFAAVQALLQHRLDGLRQPMSIHYVGEEAEGGWTTLDAGASPGLATELLPLVTPEPAVAAPEKVVTKVKAVARRKKAAKK